MKFVRFLIVGIVLGGAFGAKIGTYLTQILSDNVSFQLVESGFILGASLGFFTSLIIQLVNSGVFEQRNETRNSLTLAGQS